MTSLIIADDFIGASFIQDRQLRNFLLDCVHPSEERMDVRPIHALTGIDQRDLGLVLAGRCQINSLFVATRPDTATAKR